MRRAYAHTTARNESAHHRVCAIPGTKPFDFVFECTGTVSAAVRQNCSIPPACNDPSSLCASQMAALKASCLLTMAHSEPYPLLAPRFWLSRMGQPEVFNASIAVFGDSMARQSFNTAISLLRGDTIFIDPVSFSSLSFTLAASSHRMYSFFGLPFPPGLPPKSPRWVADMKALAAKGSSSSGLATLATVGYTHWPCYGDEQWQTMRAAIHSGVHDVVVIHAPNYWHLQGVCKRASGMIGNSSELLADRDRIVRFWRTLVNGTHGVVWASGSRGGRRRPHAVHRMSKKHTRHVSGGGSSSSSRRWPSSSATRVIVVNAPAENVLGQNKASWREDHTRAMNDLVRDSLAGLDDAGWSLVDWASLMRSRRPPHEFAGNWHYSCSMYPTHPWVWQNQKNAYIKVTVRDSGDCEEAGNSILWKELLFPRIERVLMAS